jgi:hypothetical protein
LNSLAKILEERQKKFELDLSLAKEQKQASIISDGAGAKPVALKPQSLIPQEAPTAPQLNKMDLSLNELSDPDPNGFSLNTIEEMLSKVSLLRNPFLFKVS